jgi:glucokinase
MQGREGIRPVSGDGVVGALDIGGTHVSAGAVDLTTHTVDNDSRIRISFRGSDLLADIVRAASTVMRPGVDRLGVAVPGPFDYAAGVSLIEHKLEGLHGVDLRSELSAALGIPRAAVRFVNDAEAFLLGEWWSGAARGHARAVGVTIGTGLGSAFIANDLIVRSGPGVPPLGALYELSFRGAPVEDTISSRGLLGSYGSGEGQAIDVEDVAARAQTGEPAARDAFEGLGRALGQFLVPCLHAFAPSCLVVGGSVARSWMLFAHALRAELESIASLEVVAVAEQLDDAPLLGAAWHLESTSA